MKTSTALQAKEKELMNNDLEKVVKIAKSKGYRVYTFESSSKYIKQIFIENEKGNVGSCSAFFDGVQFSTVHKSKQGSGNGTGFGGLIQGQDFNNPKDLDICFITAPYWAKPADIYKYTSFQDYIDKGLGILTYYEI